MKREDFYNTLNNIEDKYVQEAKTETAKRFGLKTGKPFAQWQPVCASFS